MWGREVSREGCAGRDGGRAPRPRESGGPPRPNGAGPHTRSRRRPPTRQPETTTIRNVPDAGRRLGIGARKLGRLPGERAGICKQDDHEAGAAREHHQAAGRRPHPSRSECCEAGRAGDHEEPQHEHGSPMGASQQADVDVVAGSRGGRAGRGWASSRGGQRCRSWPHAGATRWRADRAHGASSGAGQRRSPR
jgi:hypothetical protein